MKKKTPAKEKQTQGFAPRPREHRAAVHSLCYSVGSSAHSPVNSLRSNSTGSCGLLRKPFPRSSQIACSTAARLLETCSTGFIKSLALLFLDLATIYKLQCHTTCPLFSAILYRRTDAGQSKGMPVRSAIKKSRIFALYGYSFTNAVILHKQAIPRLYNLQHLSQFTFRHRTAKTLR